MADKGFDIPNDKKLDLKLNIPPYFQNPVLA